MMDLVLAAWVAALIESAKLSHLLGHDRSWQPGRPLRLLFAGYNGARNTGSDVRVREMLRQVRRVLGPERVELSVMTQDPALTRGYFGDARQVRLPDIFPPFLAREVPRHDGVVACEGSMFKSKFADALTLMMVGSLGLAVARNRLAVGYGAEAGRMNRVPRRLTARYVRDALVITRSEESRDLLAGLGIPVELGTDTAWTFEPHPPACGERLLRAAGWAGQPVLAICPINPFWWPVRASLLKGLVRLLGGYRKSHYRSVYFHAWNARRARAYERYLAAIANAARAFRERTGCLVVAIAMERLDREPCERLAARLETTPVFGSDEHDMFELVSVARRATWMLSSRYHGIVTTMPAGVVSAGVTMDERIRNLMRQRGQPDLCVEVDAPDLEARLEGILRRLERDAGEIREGICRTTAAQLEAMAHMGLRFEEHVRECFPGFETRAGLSSWSDYLPELGPGLQRLLEAHAP